MISSSAILSPNNRDIEPTIPRTTPDSNMAARATAAVQPHMFVMATVSEFSKSASSVAKPTPIEVCTLMPIGIFKNVRERANRWRM